MKKKKVKRVRGKWVTVQVGKADSVRGLAFRGLVVLMGSFFRNPRPGVRCRFIFQEWREPESTFFKGLLDFFGVRR